MGKFKALLLAGTASLTMAGAGKAADLPLAPTFEPGVIEPVAFGGWYLRGDVGVGASSKPEIKSTFSAPVTNPKFEEGSLSDVTFVGLGLGYQFNKWFRADVTGEYRTSQSIYAIESAALNGADARRGYDIYNGKIQSSVFLLNGYVDVGTWYGITPFIGAGVGGAYNRIIGLSDMGQGLFSGGFGTASDSEKFALAYAGHAGLSYAVTPNLKLELAYRYLNMGSATSNAIQCSVGSSCERQKYKLESQDIKLGMRWMFSDIQPVEAAVYAPPPPPPLVRKY